VKTDAVTSGSWKGVYGADGYNIMNDAVSYPAYATVTSSGNGTYTWEASTADPRATQKASSATDRLAACWVTHTSFDTTLAFSDTASHQVALYLLDWDNFGGGRTERIDILESNGNLLDSRTASNFTGGLYLVWNMTGRVTIRITNTNSSSNAVISALLFR
jgi:hypothetical protein